MNRILITTPIPQAPDEIPSGIVVIAPHTAASETFGVRKLTLFSLASQHLEKAGLGIASEFESFEYLKRSITRVDPDANPAALATRIRTILRTLLRTGVDVDELENRGSEQVKQLARIAREYEHRLEERDLVDNSAVLWRAAMLTPEPVPLFVYGYFRARKEEIVFINAVAGEDSVYYLPCGADPIFEINNRSAEYLATVGKWQILNELEQRTYIGRRAAQRFVEPSGEVPLTAVSFHNLESEVRFVLGKTKSLLKLGVCPEDIAIVARDSETYAPLISEVSAEYGVAVELRNKVAVSHTLLGSFVECLLAANETDFEFETTASLLMHPFGPGLTAYEWKMARKHRVGGVEEWSALSPHLNCLNWKTEAAWSEWVECMLDTFRGFDVRKKSAGITREIVAYNAFIDALAILNRLTTSLVSQFEFFNAIRELMAATRVSYQPSRGGITVHNLDTIQGAKYGHVFILGMAEGMLPAPVIDNPVIDFFERAELAPHGIEFEEAAEVARWAALSFYLTLVVAGESITLTVPMTIGDSYKIASPYFARLGVHPKAGHSEEISSASEELRILLRSSARGDEKLGLARKQLEVEAFRESIAMADEYDGVIGIAIDPTQRSWSASQFTVLGQCPYRWFAQKVLELKSADEAETSLTPAIKGTLYHKTLELAVERTHGAADLRNSILEILEECFTQAESDPEVGLPKMENWAMQRREHVNAIRKAVESPKFIDQGATVVAFEEKFETVWNGLLIKGRIDRVDRSALGLVAIDYKTSSSIPSGVKNDAGKSNIDIQLAVYSQVALPHLYPDEPVNKGLYYSLTKGKVLKSIDVGEMPSLVDLVNKMHGLLKAGNFAVDPDVDGNACKYCEFDVMCRKGTRLARKTKAE